MLATAKRAIAFAASRPSLAYDKLHTLCFHALIIPTAQTVKCYFEELLTREYDAFGNSLGKMLEGEYEV